LACSIRFITISSKALLAGITGVAGYLVTLADNRLGAESFAAAPSNLVTVAVSGASYVAVEKMGANSAEATPGVALKVVIASVLCLFLAHQALIREGTRVSRAAVSGIHTVVIAEAQKTIGD
jgi:hypothetical protein